MGQEMTPVEFKKQTGRLLLCELTQNNYTANPEKKRQRGNRGKKPLKENDSSPQFPYRTPPDKSQMQPRKFPRKRRGVLRLPWKRGPRAWEIAQRAESILEALSLSRREFYSLRRTAMLLGISTQPVRDWIRLGQLKREGPRRQITRSELRRFLMLLVRRAEPYAPENYLDRIERHRKVPRWRWGKIVTARFDWPKGIVSLKPSQLAGLVGCHPSLITKAIRAGRLIGQRRTPHRYVITRWAWQRANYR
jgi:hypothetical protein